MPVTIDEIVAGLIEFRDTTYARLDVIDNALEELQSSINEIKAKSDLTSHSEVVRPGEVPPLP